MKFYDNGDGLTEPRGFFCSGVHCDIKGKKDRKLDLGLVYSRSLVRLLLCLPQTILRQHRYNILNPYWQKKVKTGFHAVVANSGNANACTGKQGLADAKKWVRKQPDN